MELKEKVALVTGGASGLGQATVEAFVAKGAKAVILDINEEKASGGLSITVEISRVLLFPVITWPTNKAIPKSPGVLYLLSVDIADSIASVTCFFVDLDFIF